MKTRVLLDTGPLIASLNSSERHHSWTVERLKNISPPLLTCEAVISEACFVLKAIPQASTRVLEMVQRGFVEIPFRLDQEIKTVQRLMKKYSNLPASLADVCLVRMSEIYDQSSIFTLDHDFDIYRQHGRRTIPVIMPERGKGRR